LKNKHISSVNAKLGWLTKVCGVYLVVFSMLLIGQQGLGLFFRHQPLLPIGLMILQTVRQRQGKLTKKTPLTLCEAARQSTFVTDTPFVIRRGQLK
jgi:hypothetical protein